MFIVVICYFPIHLILVSACSHGRYFYVAFRVKLVALSLGVFSTTVCSRFFSLISLNSHSFANSVYYSIYYAILKTMMSMLCVKSVFFIKGYFFKMFLCCVF